MRAILERLESGPQGTFGKFTVGNTSFFSGELSWRDNHANISCIPTGLYCCTFTYSVRFKKYMYLVLNVDGRDGIRLHSANLMGDSDKGYRCQLNGCIALGEKLGTIEGQKALLISRPAITKLENLMERKDFILEVKNG